MHNLLFYMSVHTMFFVKLQIVERQNVKIIIEDIKMYVDNHFFVKLQIVERQNVKIKIEDIKMYVNITN
jgi:hypothetical protein